jgi:hypothetical protein
MGIRCQRMGSESADAGRQRILNWANGRNRTYARRYCIQYIGIAMTSLHYINSKLLDAIYILTIDEGDARTRLAKVLPKIKLLSTSSFPLELQNDFDWVKSTMQRGIGVTAPGWPPPDKLTGITNATASKVIQKIVDIQYKVDLLVDSEIES